MTKTAFNRDGVLTGDERRASANKCVNLLIDYSESMSTKERQFVEDITDTTLPVTERQLAWLRDLVSKYVTS